MRERQPSCVAERVRGPEGCLCGGCLCVSNPCRRGWGRWGCRWAHIKLAVCSRGRGGGRHNTASGGLFLLFPRVAALQESVEMFGVVATLHHVFVARDAGSREWRERRQTMRGCVTSGMELTTVRS